MHTSVEIKLRVKNIRKTLKSSVGFYERSNHTKIPFKVEIFVNALSLRILEHIDAVVCLYDKNLFIPAFALIRSNFESLALLNVVASGIEKSLKEDKLDERFKEELESISLGTREDGDTIKAINVITQLKKMDKKFKGIWAVYSSISEFVHPNYDGVLGGYSEIYYNEKRAGIEPHLSKTDKLTISSFGFTGEQLNILEQFTNFICHNLSGFTTLCEDNIKEKYS